MTTLTERPVPRGFHDARTIEDRRELSCDVCVIGSGAAGTTVALRLRQHGRSVVLVESGGASTDATATALNDLDTPALPIGPESRTRVLGGTTGVWWGVSAMLGEQDLAPRPWLRTPGWPITYDDLIPYYSQACDLLAVPDLTTIPVARFATGRGFLVRSDDLDTVTLFCPRRPRRFGDLLRTAVQRDGGIQAFLHATVTRIALSQSGREVDRLELRTVSGRELVVRPSVVVVACGAIENARLLLASGNGGGGVGNDRGVVGRFYMDHPKGPAGAVRVAGGAEPLPHPGYWDSGPGRFRLGICLSPERQRRDHLLNGHVRFQPALAHEGRGAAALRALRRRGASAATDLATWRDMIAGLPDLIRFARFKMLNRGTIREIEIHNFIEQEPRPENRVVLSDRTDVFGNPLPQVSWSVGELEQATMRELHRLLDNELLHRSFGRLASPLLTAEDDPWPITRDASHHMGTTRMGDDPSTSVVDRDGLVHGVSNLYIAGSSVFPTSGSANPTLTIVALSLRLGDHLGTAVGST